MFKNLKMKMKMFVILGIVILITIAVGIVGFIGMNGTLGNLNTIHKEKLAKIYNLLIMDEAQKSVVIGERALINEKLLDSKLRQPQYKYIDDARKRIKGAMEAYIPLPRDKDEEVKWSELEAAMEKWEAVSKKVVEMSAQRDELAAGTSTTKQELREFDNKVFSEYLDSRLAFLPVEEIMKKIVDENIGEANDLGKKSESSAKMDIAVLAAAILIGVALSVLFGTLISANIVKAIKAIQNLMSQAEKGDLTVKGEVKSQDELGQLTTSFNAFIERIHEMTKDIYTTTISLNKSSDSLLQISEVMAGNSEESSAKTSVVSATVEEISAGMLQTASTLTDTSGNVNIIASAVEEMSGTIRNLASASEQTSVGVNQATDLVTQISGSIGNVSDSSKDMSASVNSVATAIKEINISLNEISKNCERSIYITSDADTKAKDTNSIIEKLNNSSKQIGKIVNVINDIADQTNMLALNAAIEAAGAGEAGKGFAVVANEVKELAKQTAEATDEISQQIETMQFNMSGAVKAVETITEVIKEITSITNTIAAAVTEQSATTGDISNAIVKAAEKVNLITKEISDVASNSQNAARSIFEASKGVGEIARSASELSSASNEVAHNTEKASLRLQEVTRTSHEISRGANEISQNIQEINSASADTAAGAEETTNSAKELSDMAARLEGLVKQFKI